MARHIVIVAVLWVSLTIAGEAAALTLIPFPVSGAEEAEIVDDAFTLLAVLGVPVGTFVMSVLAYSAFRFRRVGTPDEDGSPLRTHRGAITVWLAITTALCVAVIIHPGITGLNELRASEDKPPDLLVQVEAGQWFWNITYPEQGVFSRKELVLPVGTHTLFKIQNAEPRTENEHPVLHSFWIPAFRVKIDVVPGLVTKTAATPNKLGDSTTDANYRLQCAELCGLGHALMQIPVRVVERGEFDAWIAEQSPIR